MPSFTHHDATIYYEEFGQGFPILTFAPAGLQSVIGVWSGPSAPVNPTKEFAGNFRVIAMDQRNAGGKSRAPITAQDGWHSYLADHTASRELRWVNRDGTTGGAIDTVPAGALQDPRLSPDGSRVLITRDGDIWIYDLASGRGSKVTKDGRSQMGVWDPTGTRVAYSSAKGSVMEAWVAAADGSGAPRQLTHDGGLVHVDSWSPDGHVVSVHRHADESRALMIPVDHPGDPPVAFAEGEPQSEGASFCARRPLRRLPLEGQRRA